MLAHLPATLLTALLLATGCSADRSDAPPAGQVVARVDGVEITEHQLHHLLASRATASDPATRRIALESLIDQQVLASRARAARLDRDPVVLAQVQAAILQIHARAAAERIRTTAGAPDDAEIRAFYDGRPELFAQRRIYDVDEIAIAGRPPDAATLRARVAGARRLDDVAAWLDTQRIAFGRQSGRIVPEDLAADDAATLQRLAQGALAVVSAPAGAQVLQIRAIEPRPATFDAARPMIERVLLAGRRREALDREVAALRRQARIEYLREFAGDGEPRRAPSAAEKDDRLDRGLGALR